jgi:hypothetical protein
VSYGGDDPTHWSHLIALLVLLSGVGFTCAGSTGGHENEEGQGVAHLTAHEAWEIAAFDSSIRSKVALELLPSWPIPDSRDGGFGYWFFYYGFYGPPPAVEFQVYPPSWRVWISGTDGSVSELERIQPENAGLQVEEGEPFATHSWPESWSVDDADRKRVELLTAYAEVIAVWANREGEPPSRDAAELSRFRERFLELTPPPLLPCYSTLGRDFFGWLGL